MTSCGISNICCSSDTFAHHVHFTEYWWTAICFLKKLEVQGKNSQRLSGDENLRYVILFNLPQCWRLQKCIVVNIFICCSTWSKWEVGQGNTRIPEKSNSFMAIAICIYTRHFSAAAVRICINSNSDEIVTAQRMLYARVKACEAKSGNAAHSHVRERGKRGWSAPLLWHARRGGALFSHSAGNLSPRERAPR